MCKSVILENTRCTHEDISGKYAGNTMTQWLKNFFYRSPLFKILLRDYTGKNIKYEVTELLLESSLSL
jgi:hypothetical protein